MSDGYMFTLRGHSLKKNGNKTVRLHLKMDNPRKLLNFVLCFSIFSI